MSKKLGDQPMFPKILAVALISANSILIAQQAEPPSSGIGRHYTEGAILHYRMTGNNDGWRYSALATDVVKRDANGKYYEEIGWSDYSSSTHQTLSESSLALRQTVSLDDPASYLKVPSLVGVQPLLIGPITDTLTFYSDLFLAIKSNLAQPGQTAYVPRSSPNSWADGNYILIGQDVVDFALKVESVNPKESTETILVQHVPPSQMHIEVPSVLKSRVPSIPPDNFVQISKATGGFIAEAGHENFDVRLIIDTRDGRILSATMHNPVVLRTRTCADRDLKLCGPETPKTILRDIEWHLVP